MELKVKKPNNTSIEDGDQGNYIAGRATARFFTKYSLLVLLFILVLMFSILIPGTFLTFTNFRVIIATQAVLVLVALAMLFPLTVGEFNLAAPIVAFGFLV